MKSYTKIYLDYFNYGIEENIPCEYCGSVAVDIAHIVPKSKFGKKRIHERDDITNLCALCRNCHYKYDFENKISRDEIREAHRRTLESFNKQT